MPLFLGLFCQNPCCINFYQTFHTFLPNLLFSRVRGGGGRGEGYNKVIMFPLNELENGRTFYGKFIEFTKEAAIGRNSKWLNINEPILPY